MFRNFAFILVLASTITCNKEDTARPVIENVYINNILIDTLSGDTLSDMRFPVTTIFRMTDDKGVVEYRFEFARANNSSPNLKKLEIGQAGGSTDFTGSVTLDFDNAILDTISDTVPLFYFITVDCYDKSGNTGIQKKALLDIKL